MRKLHLTALAVLTAAAVSGVELLKNGDFEQKLNSWQYPDWAGKARPGSVVDDVVYGGNYAFRMGNAGDRENDLYQHFIPDPGKGMQLTVMLKADGVPDNDVKIRLLARQKGKVLGWVAIPAGSGVNDLVSCGGTFDWKEFKKTIPVSALPAGTDSLLVYIKRLNNGTGTLWIDEISLNSFEEKAAAPKKEAWKPTGKLTPGSFDAAEARTGGQSYCMHQTGDAAANGIYQSIQYQPGHDVTAAIALKATGGVPERDVTLHVLTFVHGKPGPWVQNPPGSGVNELAVTGGDFDWKEFKIAIPADELPDGVTSLIFYVKRKNNTAGKLYVDDMKVEFRPAATPQATADRPGAVFTPGGNLWPGDGSFEAGTPFFLLPYDEKESFHGERSLRADPGKPIRSGYLFETMQPGKKYVLSCRVKSDRKGVFTMRASTHQWREIGRGSVELSTGWQRVNLRLPAQKSLTSLSLDFFRPDDATVWLDGFQLVEGSTPQPYVPGSPLDLGVERTGEPGELLTASESPLEATISLRNNTGREQSVKLVVELEDSIGKRTTLLSGNRTINPGENLREQLPVAATREPGYRIIRLKAEMEGRTTQAALPFAVVEPLPENRCDPFFGIHPFGPTDPETLRRLGVANSRNFRNWRFTPFRDGKYDFPENWRAMARAGFRQQDCLNVAEPPPHGRTGKEAAVEFIRQSTAFFGDDAAWIELENEPDLIYPRQTGGDVVKAAEIYAETVNAAAEAIRAERPEAKILACGVSGVDFSAGFPFTRRVLELAGKNIDLLPVHPYSHARYIDENHNDIGPEANGVRDKVLKLREIIAECGGKQKISFGEVGWALDVHADPMSVEAMRHAAYTARLLLTGKALEVENVMYFLADYCIERDHYYYGLWRNTLPLPAAAAYATAARQLNGAKAHRTVSAGEVQCFTFLRGDGKPMAAVWSDRETPFDMELAVSPAELEIRDMLGNPVSVEPAPATRLRISGKPLYLISQNSGADQFTALLAAAKVDLPPARCVWRLLNDRCVTLLLTNERAVELEATVKLSGAPFAGAERVVKLSPGRSTELQFESTKSLNNRPLVMELTGNLGSQRDTYRADLLPCPRRRAGAFSPDLPDRGGLPFLNSRKFLIPNDPNNGYDGEDDLALASAVGFDAENLYIDCNVTDDIHSPGVPGRLWAADSIQLAIDSRADAPPNEYSFGRDDYEFTFGLTADGTSAAQIDYIYERGRQEQARKALKCEIRRVGNQTVYRIAIPWSVLKIDPQPGTVFGMNFIANDNDGHGRLYWMGPTPGIGENKHPGAYRKFILTE